MKVSENARLWLIGGVVVLVIAGVAALLFAGGSDDDATNAGGTTTTIAPKESTTTTANETTTTEAEETTTTEAEETTTTEAEETTTTEAADETTTSGPVEDGEDTLNAITVEIDGDFIVFTENVECALGADYAGTITADAEDGTTFEAVLDETASAVDIDGPSGTYEAEVTNLSNSQTILTLLAEPPTMEVSVGLAFCEEVS